MIQRILLPALLASLLIMSCGEKSNPTDPPDDTTTDPPTVSSFSPTCGGVGSTVTIQGTNFGSDASKVTARLGGKSMAIVSVAPTRVVATVPAGGASGSIEVEVAGRKVTASGTFNVTTGLARYSEAILTLANLPFYVERDSTYTVDGVPETTADTGRYSFSSALNAVRTVGADCMAGVHGDSLEFLDGASYTRIGVDTVNRIIRSLVVEREQNIVDSTVTTYRKNTIYLTFVATDIPYTLGSDGTIVARIPAAALLSTVDVFILDTQYYSWEKGASVVEILVNSSFRELFDDDPAASIQLVLR